MFHHHKRHKRQNEIKKDLGCQFANTAMEYAAEVSERSGTDEDVRSYLRFAASIAPSGSPERKEARERLRNLRQINREHNDY
ncbi:MAG: hypothetical protein ABTQ34_09440 [Bdellovibrionales bacterium]